MPGTRRTECLLAALLLQACANGSPPTEPTVQLPPVVPVASIAVTTPDSVIDVARSVQLTAVARDSAGGPLTGRPLSWSVSDSALAQVSGTGLLTAVAPGHVTVRARSDGIAGTADIDILVAFEAGGSNYPMYSVGAYLDSPDDETWYTPRVLRPVVGTYHLDSASVSQQLATMYANGQRRIALVLWFTHPNGEERLASWPERSYGHMLIVENGRLDVRHEANLRAVLTRIRALRFEEVVVRWAPQAHSDPARWSAWDEDMYANSWGLISSTAVIVEEVLGGAVRTVHDLGLEMGGIDGGQRRPYRVRLWRDWVERFGAHASVGFSYAVAPGRLTREMSVYDEVGARPRRFAFDLYGDVYGQLAALREELAAAGEGARPIVIQEAYYDDAMTASAIRRAREGLKMNIRTIFQWPLARGATQPHFSVHFPAAFGAYVPLAGR